MDTSRTDPSSWYWIGKYLVVIIAALVLGSTLAALEPFKSAEIGSAHVGAGALVRFIAHCGALTLLWALGFRHARQLRGVRGPSRHLADTVLALITLIVIASAYGVLLHFISPMLASDVKPFIDWFFIVGILAAALWLLWVLFTDSEKVIEAVSSLSLARRQAQPQPGRPLVDQIRS